MVVLGLLAALLAYMYCPMPVKIIISRETTYTDGPLNPDGTVNYVAYLATASLTGHVELWTAAEYKKRRIRLFGPDEAQWESRNA